MDTNFMTEWFGVTGAVFVVIFSLFKIIYPKIDEQMKVRNEIKMEENRLKVTEQENIRNMIDSVKITNELVAKNNEAFSRHNTIFDIHIQLIQELKESQKQIKSDLHRRFDIVDDKIEDHHKNALLITYKSDEMVNALKSLYGLNTPTERGKNETNKNTKLR